MSAALVKKSLELFENDLTPQPGPSKKKMKKDPMSMISTKKKGVKKQLRNLQKPNPQKRKSSKHKWSALEQYRYSQPEDYTEASVQALQRLAEVNQMDKKTSKCILDHHLDKKTIKRLPIEKEKKIDVETVFTDKDFEDFEKEFDFSNIK